MALLNWILLIALVIALAHVPEPTTSFTNGVLEFTNSTCARVLSSWDSFVLNAKAVDARMLAFETQVWDSFVRILPVRESRLVFDTLAEALRPSKWMPPTLYADMMSRMCH